MQEKPQLPPEHVAVALPTAVVHLLPHAWQFWVSVCSSTQLPPHRLWPLGQPDTQTAGPPPSIPPSAADAEHTGVPASALQATPQNPQLDAVSRVTQLPPQRV